MLPAPPLETLERPALPLSTAPRVAEQVSQFLLRLRERVLFPVQEVLRVVREEDLDGISHEARAPGDGA